MPTTPGEPLEEWLASLSGRVKHWPGMGRDLLGLVSLVILAAWALLNWSLTIRSVIRDYNPLPDWDYWQVAEHLERYKALDFSVLWIQHNEHRIVFPETVFAADMLLFHGLQIFPLIISFCCYLGVWGVLAWAFNSDKALSPMVRRAGMLFAAIVIGWQGSSVVLGNTFLLQWTMLQLAVVLSLALLAESRNSSKTIYLIAAILCAVIATYSSGNGMVVWPILLAAGFLMRIPKLHLLSLGVSAFVAIGLYFTGYHSTRDLQMLNVVKHPIYVVGFICSYLSMPLGALGQPGIAVLSGALNLFVWLLLLWYIDRKRMLTSTPAIVLFGSFVFTLVTAALTAAGRMNVSDPFFLEALGTRYVSLPLVNWAALLLSVLWISARRNWELLETSFVGVLAFLCLIGMTSALRPWVTGNGSFIADKQVASLSVENDLNDPALEVKLYPDPGFVLRMLPVLHRNQVAIYAGVPELSWLGQNAKTLFGSCEESQAGSISRVFPVHGGLEILGSASVGLDSPEVVFVDESGRVVGFGEEVKAGIPSGVTEQPKGAIPWIGFINLRFGSKAFSTYLVRGHGRELCSIGQPRPL